MNNTITEEKLDKYLKLTREALDTVEKVDIDELREPDARDLKDLANRYYSDAIHFKEKGEWVMAFTAVCYAHAFLDVGARLGLFKVDDSRLFMVDDDTTS